MHRDDIRVRTDSYGSDQWLNGNSFTNLQDNARTTKITITVRSK